MPAAALTCTKRMMKWLSMAAIVSLIKIECAVLANSPSFTQEELQLRPEKGQWGYVNMLLGTCRGAQGGASPAVRCCTMKLTLHVCVCEAMSTESLLL